MIIRTEWNNPVNSDLYFNKEETINDVVENFNIRRNYSAEGISVTINDTTVNVIVQDHTNPINSGKADKKMLIPMDTVIESGDYVLYRGDTWIVISRINIVDDAYKACQIQLCNYTLTFQHNKTGEILSYPCIDETTSTAGIEEGKVISTGNAVHTIKLPFDDVTKLIDVDDRFFIDDLSVEMPQVYAVSKPNRTTCKYGNKGLIELTMKQSSYNKDTDNRELGICDYIVNDESTLDDTGEYAVIKCSNTKNELSVGGGFRTLTATFYDNNNNIVESIVPIWTVDYKGVDNTDFVVEFIEKQLRIKVKDNYDLLGHEITVHVTNNPNNYQGFLDLLINI